MTIIRNKMKELHSKIKELQLRAAPINYSESYVDKSGSLNDKGTGGKAYFCIWGERDTYGTMFMKGCFSKSIRERGPESSANQKIAFCWQHDIKDPIGRNILIVEDDLGAYTEYEFDDVEAVPSAKRAKAQIRSGTINGYSFGFDYIWDKMEYDEDTDAVLIKECDLHEISPVTRPSLSGTHSVRSVEEFETEKICLNEETEDFIRSVPRSRQLELRQLISRHISLAKVKPDELRHIPLKNNKPDEQSDKLDINLLLTKI